MAIFKTGMNLKNYSLRKKILYLAKTNNKMPEINYSHEILMASGFTAGFGLMFAISEFIYSRFKIDAEYTRKFVHISCGSIAMLVAVVQVHVLTIALLGVVFALLTWYMLSHDLLPSVHAVARHSIGSILFPIGVVVCVIFGRLTAYGITFFVPLATMLYCDTIAALVGVNYPLRKYRIFSHTKSLGGSIGFFVSAFLVYILFYNYFIPEQTLYAPDHRIGKGLLFAITTTMVEFFSVDGWDDFTIPFAAMGILWLTGFN
jgi:phytol kinase